jgi:hypothetical protein
MADTSRHAKVLVYKVGNYVHQNQKKMPLVVEDDSEIGSPYVMKVIAHESQLGGYSMEDGSMRGAYGDGEYAD